MRPGDFAKWAAPALPVADASWLSPLERAFSAGGGTQAASRAARAETLADITSPLNSVGSRGLPSWLNPSTYGAAAQSAKQMGSDALSALGAGAEVGKANVMGNLAKVGPKGLIGGGLLGGLGAETLSDPTVETQSGILGAILPLLTSAIGVGPGAGAAAATGAAGLGRAAGAMSADAPAEPTMKALQGMMVQDLKAGKPGMEAVMGAGEHAMKTTGSMDKAKALMAQAMGGLGELAQKHNLSQYLPYIGAAGLGALAYPMVSGLFSGGGEEKPKKSKRPSAEEED